MKVTSIRINKNITKQTRHHHESIQNHDIYFSKKSTL